MNKFTKFLNLNWRWLILIGFLLTLAIYIVSKFSANFKISDSGKSITDQPCIDKLINKDSSDYVLVYAAFKTKDPTKFNINEFSIEGINFGTVSCMIEGEDALEMTTYINVGPLKKDFKVKSNIYPKKQNFRYALGLVVMTAKGDTIGRYQTKQRSVGIFENDPLLIEIKTTRNENPKTLTFINIADRDE